jgi:hypothetical protein
MERGRGERFWAAWGQANPSPALDADSKFSPALSHGTSIAANLANPEVWGGDRKSHFGW